MEWYEDDTSLPVIFKEESSSVQLKLQEHGKEESWEIIPLMNPPMVYKN